MVIYVNQKRMKKKAPLCDMIVSLKIQHTQRKKVLSMINSIRHFVEKETYEIEKTMRILKKRAERGLKTRGTG